MYLDRLASQIVNDVVSGLRGYHQNLSLNIEQIKDEIISCRLQVLHEFFLKGVFPIKDLLSAINCIPVDCKSLERCPSCGGGADDNEKIQHFEIPQLVSYYGKESIDYIGSTDRMNRFIIGTSLLDLQQRKYKKRGANKPYVWIDMAPNSNGKLDCYLFNAPFVDEVSVVGVFKNPRDLEDYSCCDEESINESFIDQIIKDKLVKEKIQYYRQYKAQLLPNDQQYTT